MWLALCPPAGPFPTVTPLLATWVVPTVACAGCGPVACGLPSSQSAWSSVACLPPAPAAPAISGRCSGDHLGRETTRGLERRPRQLMALAKWGHTPVLSVPHSTHCVPTAGHSRMIWAPTFISGQESPRETSAALGWGRVCRPSCGLEGLGSAATDGPVTCLLGFSMILGFPCCPPSHVPLHPVLGWVSCHPGALDQPWQKPSFLVSSHRETESRGDLSFPSLLPRRCLPRPGLRLMERPWGVSPVYRCALRRHQACR